jgi:hypothetical protein
MGLHRQWQRLLAQRERTAMTSIDDPLDEQTKAIRDLMGVTDDDLGPRVPAQEA